MTARGFSGDISGATNIRFALGQHPLEPVRTQTFTLKKSDDPIQTPPYLELTPESGSTGNRVLTIGANTILHSAGSPGDAPTFSVESVSKGDIGLELGSGSVELNGERYIIPEVGLAPPGDSFHKPLTGMGQLGNVKIRIGVFVPALTGRNTRFWWDSEIFG